MPITIYHNPKCSTSRKCLDLIRQAGHTPKVVPYLDMPLDRIQLSELLRKMQAGPRDLVRAKEPLYAELGLDVATDDQLVAAMARYPILMNRPVVETDKGAALCRPQERVMDLL